MTLMANLSLEPRVLRWTVREYTRMAGLLVGRRTELIDGQVIEMPAIGTAHYTVTSRLRRQLGSLADQGRLAIADPVVITDFDEPEPDLCVLLHPVELRKIVTADIALLIEVSDTSYDYDHGTKLPRYLAAGIPNVWLVNIHDHARPRLERYALGAGDRPEQSSGQVPVPSAALVLDLDALFAGLEVLPSDEYEPRLP
jgi:Uma2 family endonuclease